VFINLADNSATHDAEPFVPFGKVVEGMEIADALNSAYGESAGGGIRGGKQGSLFESGNNYLVRNFPRLDFIRRVTVIDSPQSSSHLTAPSWTEQSQSVSLLTDAFSTPPKPKQERFP